MDMGEWLPGALKGRAAQTAGLCLLAVLGMALQVPLFYSVAFVFGSVASMLAARLLGVVPAMTVGLVAGGCAGWLWGHPYAMAIFAAEGLVVAALYRRSLRNLVLADLVFWLTLGVPLVLAFYRGVMDMPWQAALLIAVKQPLNGVFNALLAGLLVIGCRLAGHPRYRRYMSADQLSNLLFHVILLLVLLVGAVPVVYQGYTQTEREERTLARRLGDRAGEIAAHIAGAEGAGQAQWQQWLREAQLQPAWGLALLGPDGGVLSRVGTTLDGLEQPVSRRRRGHGLVHWAPDGIDSVMERWKRGRYRLSVDYPGEGPVARVVVEQPALPLVARAEARGATLLVLLASLLGGTILVLRPLSLVLTQPISRLARVAANTTNGVVITDTDGRVEWLNEAFSRFSGYRIEDLAGRKPGHVLQGPDTDAETVQRLRESLNTSGRFDAELVNYRKDGTPYWVEVSCSPLPDGAGGVSGYLGIQTDISERKRYQAWLREERRRLRDIIWATQAGTWEWNVRTGELRLSQRSAEIVGYALDELEPLDIDAWHQLTHPEEREASAAALTRHFQSETDAYQCELRIHHRAGHWVWVMSRGRVVSWTPSAEPLMVSGTHVDITERKNARLAAEASHERLDKLVRRVPGVVYQYRQWPDGSACFPYASPGLREMYGVDPEAVTEDATPVFERLYAEDLERVQAGIQHSFETLTTWRDQFRSVSPGGALLWLDGRAEPEAMPDGSVLWHGYIRDISEFKQQHDQLERSAHYDGLTGLPNRVLLADRLRQAIAGARRHSTLTAVVYLDLDGFKPVNDSHGHATGDALLRSLAAGMAECVRETDTVARVGGDEFVVVLNDLLNRRAAEQVVERLIARIAVPVSVAGVNVQVSASAGISFLEDAEQTADDLMREADKAMYAAKGEGRGRCRVAGRQHNQPSGERHGGVP